MWFHRFLNFISHTLTPRLFIMLWWTGMIQQRTITRREAQRSSWSLRGYWAWTLTTRRQYTSTFLQPSMALETGKTICFTKFVSFLFPAVSLNCPIFCFLKNSYPSLFCPFEINIFFPSDPLTTVPKVCRRTCVISLILIYPSLRTSTMVGTLQPFARSISTYLLRSMSSRGEQWVLSKHKCRWGLDERLGRLDRCMESYTFDITRATSSIPSVSPDLHSSRSWSSPQYTPTLMRGVRCRPRPSFMLPDGPCWPDGTWKLKLNDFNWNWPMLFSFFCESLSGPPHGDERSQT